MCQRCNIESQISASAPPSFRQGPVASIFPCSWRPSFRPLGSKSTTSMKRREHDFTSIKDIASSCWYREVRAHPYGNEGNHVCDPGLPPESHASAPRRANGDEVQNQHRSQARHVKIGAHAEDHGGRASSRRLVIWSLFGTAITGYTPAR